MKIRKNNLLTEQTLKQLVWWMTRSPCFCFLKKHFCHLAHMCFIFRNILGQAFKLWGWISSLWRKQQSQWKPSPRHPDNWPLFQSCCLSQKGSAVRRHQRSERILTANWEVILWKRLEMLCCVIWPCYPPIMLRADSFTSQIFLNLFCHQM